MTADREEQPMDDEDRTQGIDWGAVKGAVIGLTVAASTILVLAGITYLERAISGPTPPTPPSPAATSTHWACAVDPVTRDVGDCWPDTP